MKEKNIKRYSKLALIGFVFAILSIMNTLIFIIRNIQDPFFVLYLEYDAIFIAIGFLLALITLIFSILGLKEVNNKKLKGRWMVVFGIVIGVVKIVWLLYAFIAYLAISQFLSYLMKTQPII